MTLCNLHIRKRKKQKKRFHGMHLQRNKTSYCTHKKIGPKLFKNRTKSTKKLHLFLKTRQFFVITLNENLQSFLVRISFSQRLCDLYLSLFVGTVSILIRIQGASRVTKTVTSLFILGQELIYWDPGGPPENHCELINTNNAVKKKHI